MAISENSLLLKGFRGSIGKQIVIRNYGDKIVLSAYPEMSDRKLTPRQKKQNERMRIANKEVQRIKADERLRNETLLRLNVTRNKLHHALLKEVLINLSKENTANV